MGLNKFQNVTTILFDLDNTLINTKGADRLACQQVSQYLQNCGIRRSTAREVVDKFYNLIREQPHDPNNEDGDVDAWRVLLWKQALGPGLSTKASIAYSMWKESRTIHLKFDLALQNMLVELRKHYKLGLITNGPSSSQWEKIRKVNGSIFFDAIVVSGDVKHSKPGVAIFEDAFRILDSSSLECVMVGDNLNTDIKGGIRANCAATVWISDEGLPDREGCPKPDFQVSNVTDIMDLLPERKGFSFLCQDRSVGLYHSMRDETHTGRVN
ncbi:N-acylneuraminate-9-phosphatase [Parasteatoda tepidariorum]|uniref:N-acylneuraminate-9-phosphatase n=1 Tax=Parasteatoda tepidariorum TaxID=114398 RepID=A0A2L2YCH9_PARTP|nr:N-acylneuraminate-9-phosphatase [Parasteatoda tepidariorum]